LRNTLVIFGEKNHIDVDAKLRDRVRFRILESPAFVSAQSLLE